MNRDWMYWDYDHPAIHDLDGWEQHLAWVRSWPDDISHKAREIEHAKEAIAFTNADADYFRRRIAEIEASNGDRRDLKGLKETLDLIENEGIRRPDDPPRKRDQEPRQKR